ncbi:unnamed protein product [Linum trigynum]|uniref:WRKY domain-containing protein n=1 Tax=Linum trigynum TaxID=586398 RepID=A0AAV2GIL9_9ROSI
MAEEDHQLYFHHHRYTGAGDDAAPVFPNYPSPPAGGSLVDKAPPPASTPYNNMSLTDCLHGSADHYHSLAKAFALDANPSPSLSSSEVEDHQAAAAAAAAVEDDGSNNINCPDNKKEKSTGKGKKVQAGKGEKKKRQREPRFAFMTKSEVEHLEDGYRWRKYGQKAVKNSPYPRSYYRCTTQRCGVKKRVERSFDNPSVVVTTYEGQHNHHLPSTLRGNVAAASAAMFSHYSMLAPSVIHRPTTSFPAEFLLQLSSSPSSPSPSGHVGSLVYPRQQESFFRHQRNNQPQRLQFSGDEDYGEHFYYVI